MSNCGKHTGCRPETVPDTTTSAKAEHCARCGKVLNEFRYHTKTDTGPVCRECGFDDCLYVEYYIFGSEFA